MFVGLKLPAFLDKFNGRGFVYLDSSQANWILSPLPISSPSSAIGATVKDLYSKDKETLKIAYNDDWPDTHKANGGRGHSKGVAVANLEGGFWLIHSVPNFPPITWKKVLTAKYDYPESGTKFAQSLFCISFDVDALPAISQYMRYAQVTPFIANLPQSIKLLAPYFDDVIHRRSLSRGETVFTFSKTIKTRQGVDVTIFSKHKKFGEDLWHDFIAPSLKTSLAVETWRNGAAQDIGSQCGDGANVYDVTQVQLPSGSFSSSKDHSKWGVSMNESMPYSCIGDINRQASQFKRGGGAACIQSKTLWKTLHNSVLSFEACKINKKKTEGALKKNVLNQS
ncbi:unnamed protein product [Angiostrongylus costaricensis]|uniref:Deoxyribonuclease II n=1 Tax=Angiostrongylus costaricensis TaxID=334426 RepID=A0A0R3PFP0_ANGCS|nr:unnamed protein product [Angiostrongylus costaricensis]